MKTSFYFGIFLLAMALAGCGKEKQVVHPIPSKTFTKDFQVVIDVIAKTDDNFTLYYTTDGSINFFKIPPVWQAVEGSDKLQQVIFTVPEEIKPTQVRIDFGLKQTQPDIVLKKITMRYKGKMIVISGPQIFDYFQIDVHNCTAKASTGTIRAKIKDGKRCTPSIYPNPEILGKQVQALVK